MAYAIQHRKVSYTLELDEDEAKVLREVCSRIGGLPTSRRGLMNSIRDALESAGVYEVESPDVEGSIRFN
jgi:hypothetical protein